MSYIYQQDIVRELLQYPSETEWIEFKCNNEDPHAIGEYISALSNSAALVGKSNAYMVWGVDDVTHDIICTNFKPLSMKLNRAKYP